MILIINDIFYKSGLHDNLICKIAPKKICYRQIKGKYSFFFLSQLRVFTLVHYMAIVKTLVSMWSWIACKTSLD